MIGVGQMMQKLINSLGGKILREDNRTYWEDAKGVRYHLSNTFLRRMMSFISKQEAEKVDGRTPEPTRESEPKEVKETVEKVGEETKNQESKKKKKDRKKKPKSQVEEPKIEEPQTEVTPEENQ